MSSMHCVHEVQPKDTAKELPQCLQPCGEHVRGLRLSRSEFHGRSALRNALVQRFWLLRRAGACVVMVEN